mmetsp:Transcript_20426/g.82457  ORF Transcript_20426/g.82457 Transcript_20426/m.82457 type:complete len:107 (+) Transcript_20426:718-1038(+)
MIYELYLSKYEERVSKNGDNFLEDFEKHLVKERQEEKAKLATEAAVVDLTCHKCESGKDDEQLLICDSYVSRIVSELRNNLRLSPPVHKCRLKNRTGVKLVGTCSV